jgi:two-component system OmpR family sensor kinase
VSIRTRLALAIALVLTVTLALLGLVLVRSTRATLTGQVDDQVLAFAARVERGPWPPNHPPSAGGDGDRPSGGSPDAATYKESDLVQRPLARFVFSADGQVLVDEPGGFPDEPSPRPRLPPIPSGEIDTLIAAGRIVTVPAVSGSLAYRTFFQRGPNGTISVTAAPLAAVDAAVSRLAAILLGVGVVALAAATLASWWLIRVGLRPVDRMVETAAAIAAGDLSRRVPDADPRTELGLLGGALNEMLGQIEQAVRAKTASEERLRRFVADAAHELRTPLTSLRGYAELYRQGALRDEAGIAKAMGRIESEGARMARLVDDLLLLARLDQQRKLETSPVDIVALVREAVADLTAIDPTRPVSETGSGEAMVRGDRLRLRQVVDNLLANARTHTPPGTPVRVAVRRDGGEVEIVVADEGAGIAADLQPKVFERFWRADPGRVRSRGGSGLGLAIVASLVQAHGGTVGVTSEPGDGAVFTVRLPLAHQETAPGEQPPRAPREALQGVSAVSTARFTTPRQAEPGGPPSS